MESPRKKTWDPSLGRLMLGGLGLLMGIVAAWFVMEAPSAPQGYVIGIGALTMLFMTVFYARRQKG